MGSSAHLQFCAFKTEALGPILHVSMGPRPPLRFYACKTACLASELLLSRVPAIISGFCTQNSDFWTRITSLYGSQISTVVLCMQYSVISTRITSLHGSQTSPVILCKQNSVISIRITGLYGSQPACVVFACKTASFGPE